MKKFPAESIEEEFSERKIREKHPSEFTKSDLEFLLGRLQVAVAFSFYETDPLEKFMATSWVSPILVALKEWALWQESETIDAAIEALDNGCED